VVLFLAKKLQERKEFKGRGREYRQGKEKKKIPLSYPKGGKRQKIEGRCDSIIGEIKKKQAGGGVSISIRTIKAASRRHLSEYMRQKRTMLESDRRALQSQKGNNGD